MNVSAEHSKFLQFSGIDRVRDARRRERVWRGANGSSDGIFIPLLPIRVPLLMISHLVHIFLGINGHSKKILELLDNVYSCCAIYIYRTE
jgi:hypothetical protein